MALDLQSCLERVQQSDTIVGVHIRPEAPEKMVVGWVETVSQSWCSIREVDKHGFFDGILLFRLDDVCQIDLDDPYLRGLIKKVEQIPSNANSVNRLLFRPEDLFELAILDNHIVRFEDYNNEEFFARVISFDEHSIEFNEFDIQGDWKGHSVMPRRFIRRISAFEKGHELLNAMLRFPLKT